MINYYQALLDLQKRVEALGAEPIELQRVPEWAIVAWLRTLKGPQDPKKLADEIEQTSGLKPRARNWDVSPECAFVRRGRSGCRPEHGPAMCEACRYWNYGAEQ